MCPIRAVITLEVMWMMFFLLYLENILGLYTPWLQIHWHQQRQITLQLSRTEVRSPAPAAALSEKPAPLRAQYTHCLQNMPVGVLPLNSPQAGPGGKEVFGKQLWGRGQSLGSEPCTRDLLDWFEPQLHTSRYGTRDNLLRRSQAQCLDL